MVLRPDTDPSSLTILEAAALIRQRELSPVELTHACLSRIASWEPAINAFITVTAEHALEAARLSERQIAEGEYLGVLHGIPIAIKDNICTAGVRSTAGSRILASHVPKTDATVVSRLRAAGAVLMGKLNLHEFATGGTTFNPHFGTTRNPWDISRFAAGSSGGSGAAVVAREVLGALGTDTGGSIRLPASINGCVGLRPTIGRVSNYNVVPLAWSMDTVGPLARTVADVASILSVIAGRDARDDSSDPRLVPDYLAEIDTGVRGIRIGIVPDVTFSHQQESVREAVSTAIDDLVRLGAQTCEVSLASLELSVPARLIIEGAEASTFHHRWLRCPQDYGEDVRLLLRTGAMYTANQYIQAQRYRKMLRHELDRAFREVDVFIFPTVPFVATLINDPTVVIDGASEEMLPSLSQFTGLPSLCGLPALSVPCGFSETGLPIGMQIVGRAFDEATVLSVGHAYQGSTDWHYREPQRASSSVAGP